MDGPKNKILRHFFDGLKHFTDEVMQDTFHKTSQKDEWPSFIMFKFLGKRLKQ